MSDLKNPDEPLENFIIEVEPEPIDDKKWYRWFRRNFSRYIRDDESVKGTARRGGVDGYQDQRHWL